MLILKRAVRIKDTAQLPSGEVLEINCNVDVILPDFLKAYGDALAASEEMQKHRTPESIDRFYEYFADALKVITGKAAWDILVKEFDADTKEICDAMSGWLIDVIIPKVAEASSRRLEQKKRVRK